MNKATKPAGSQYLAELAKSVNATLGDRMNEGRLKSVLCAALGHIRSDLVHGKSVSLLGLGEMQRIEGNCGAVISFRADVVLLNDCQWALAEANDREKDTPIEDWPLEEDHRFQRSKAHAT